MKNKAMENKTYLDMTPEEVNEAYRKQGYRELQTDEMGEKKCWGCSSFRGGAIDEGCFCSAEVCKHKENKNTLISM